VKYTLVKILNYRGLLFFGIDDFKDCVSILRRKRNEYYPSYSTYALTCTHKGNLCSECFFFISLKHHDNHKTLLCKNKNYQLYFVNI
jgi:putative component of membrane protein insertase Oxa1/YidC/SpoIIIJ protein YidD